MNPESINLDDNENYPWTAEDYCCPVKEETLTTI